MRTVCSSGLSAGVTSIDAGTSRPPIVLYPEIELYESLALYHWDRNEFRIWQPITYMFMHGDFMHILFNMWGVWMFGTQLENLWGSKRFLKFYILTGLGAGILQIILFPGTSLVGASGALFGLLLGFGMMFPNAKLMLIFLPISKSVRNCVFVPMTKPVPFVETVPFPVRYFLPPVRILPTSPLPTDDSAVSCW